MEYWKAIYDLGGLNVILFTAINTVTPPWIDNFARLGSAIGSYWGAPAHFIALLIVAWHQGRVQHSDEAANTMLQIRRFVVGFALAWIIVAVLKVAVNVPRPSVALENVARVLEGADNSFGFPSGHAAYTTLILLILWPMATRSIRALLVAAAIWVMWARIAVGAHFPQDLVVGILVGVLAALLAYRVTLRPDWRAWLGLAGLIVVLDYLTKLAVIHQIGLGGAIPVTNFFEMVHSQNAGAAFSLFANFGGVQAILLTAVAFAVSAWLAWKLLHPLPSLVGAGYALILGGALANAIDRAADGFVTDFLSFYWKSWYWPAFNLADIAISSGAGLLILTMALSDRPRTNLQI
jgi:signal peptidase II